MKVHPTLVSSLFLLIPICIFLYKNKKNIWETILASLLVINIILSILFWSNPEEKSRIHFYDSIFAKISYILFPIYILFIKEINYQMKLLFLIIYLLSSIMIYYSNVHSTNEWCCQEHLHCHAIFHVLISLGCSIAFF
jgi:hypothetical protein